MSHKETCSCGASIETDAGITSVVEWRKNHRHESRPLVVDRLYPRSPVRDDPPPLPYPTRPRQPFMGRAEEAGRE